MQDSFTDELKKLQAGRGCVLLILLASGLAVLRATLGTTVTQQSLTILDGITRVKLAIVTNVSLSERLAIANITSSRKRTHQCSTAVVQLFCNRVFTST